MVFADRLGAGFKIEIAPGCLKSRKTDAQSADLYDSLERTCASVVKIRLQKLGRRNRAYFRIVVCDVRVKRQGASLENLGHYDPLEKDDNKKVTLLKDRYDYWISMGAQATPAVAKLMPLGKPPVPPAPRASLLPAAAPVAAPAVAVVTPAPVAAN
jgi:small subunit ribosomal protein S16